MSRRKIHDLRSAMHAVYVTLPLSNRSQIAEWERDLVSEANCAIWDKRLYKLSACLRRLMQLPERGESYSKVMELLAL